MNEKGFTLIELIIGIVMIAIAATMLSTNGLGVMRSVDPLNTLSDNYAVFQAIEMVNAHYRNALENDPDTSVTDYAVDDLSDVVSGLTPGMVSGTATSFSAPNAQRKVSESTTAGSRYVRITAVKNSSRLVTLLGN